MIVELNGCNVIIDPDKEVPMEYLDYEGMIQYATPEQRVRLENEMWINNK